MPTATLTTLAAAGRNPADLTILTVGSQSGGSGDGSGPGPDSGAGVSGSGGDDMTRVASSGPTTAGATGSGTLVTQGALTLPTTSAATGSTATSPAPASPTTANTTVTAAATGSGSGGDEEDDWNWRGPTWFPVNYRMVQALREYGRYYGASHTVDLPSGGRRRATPDQAADEIARRLVKNFLRDPGGRRPVFGDIRPFQTDPHWRDCIPIPEYFPRENGSGLGASHQTGWTALVAELICPQATRI